MAKDASLRRMHSLSFFHSAGHRTGETRSTLRRTGWPVRTLLLLYEHVASHGTHHQYDAHPGKDDHIRLRQETLLFAMLKMEASNGWRRRRKLVDNIQPITLADSRDRWRMSAEAAVVVLRNQ